MYELMVLTTTVLMLISAAGYAFRAWKGESHPVVATWILMMIMMSLSFWMYQESPRWTWTGNIGVTAGVVNLAIILAGVLATNLKNHTLHVAFDKVQKWCLALGVGVVGFWTFTRDPMISYVLVQCIALIAYFATVKRLWCAVSMTEPYFLWVAVLCANLCAIYPAAVRDDLFAWIYLGRAVPSTVFVIYLIARVKRKMRQEVVALTPVPK